MFVGKTFRVLSALVLVVACNAAHASVTTSLTVDGVDAIFIAGRTDIANPETVLTHNGPGHLATFPPSISVTAGDRLTFSATGNVDYNDHQPGADIGPEGLFGVGVTGLGKISGYQNLAALVGVFLDAAVPSGSPTPANFAPGNSLTSYSPGLGQVFFIGDGLTGLGIGSIQQFIAPSGAVRLFLGIPDAVSFNGAPGAYDDNAGFFNVTITNLDADAGTVPEPMSVMVWMGLGCAAINVAHRRIFSRN